MCPPTCAANCEGKVREGRSGKIGEGKSIERTKTKKAGNDLCTSISEFKEGFKISLIVFTLCPDTDCWETQARNG